jgi:hypothetical protein
MTDLLLFGGIVAASVLFGSWQESKDAGFFMFMFMSFLGALLSD